MHFQFSMLAKFTLAATRRMKMMMAYLC